MSAMKIVAIIFVLLLMGAVLVWFWAVPKNTFIIVSKPGGGTMALSRGSVSFEDAPDRYTSNGFDHIDVYVSRLVGPTNRFKFLSLFSPDGNRGFGLHAKDGVVEASLTVEWRQDPQRESDIRSFFNALGITPSEDYLAGNGNVPDATRILSYRLSGSSNEVTALTKRILKDLCGVLSTEALDISYQEK